MRKPFISLLPVPCSLISAFLAFPEQRGLFTVDIKAALARYHVQDFIGNIVFHMKQPSADVAFKMQMMMAFLTACQLIKKAVAALFREAFDSAVGTKSVQKSVYCASARGFVFGVGHCRHDFINRERPPGVTSQKIDKHFFLMCIIMCHFYTSEPNLGLNFIFKRNYSRNFEFVKRKWE